MTQCPVYSVPDRPRMARSHDRASSAEAGFPWGLPSNSSIESHPTTTASPAGSATAAALCSARMVTRVGVSGAVDQVLVHPAHHHGRVEPGIAEQAQPGRRARGQDHGTWGHGQSVGGGPGRRRSLSAGAELRDPGGMTDTGITVAPTQVDPELDGDHERMSHIVLEGFKPEQGDYISAGPSVVEGMVNGTAVKALCGKIWVPGRNPKRYPLCPTCKEIAESRGWRVPAG